MKKLLVLVFAITFTACVATNALAATDQITLGGTNPGTLAFTGDGSGNFSLTLNSISNVLAFGQGIFAGNNGVYSLTQAGTITGTLISNVNNIATWSISQQNGIAFDFSNGSTTYLTGSLQLVSLTQTQSSQTGVFDEALVANLTGLGGTLASFFTSGSGIAQITIQFASATNLASLSNGGVLDGEISTGNIQPTPEPGTMALLGSGFLLVGGYLRKRKQ